MLHLRCNFSQKENQIKGKIIANQESQYVTSLFTPSINNMRPGSEQYFFYDKRFVQFSETEKLKGTMGLTSKYLFEKEGKTSYFFTYNDFMRQEYKKWSKGKSVFFNLEEISPEKGIIKTEISARKLYSKIGEGKSNIAIEGLCLNKEHIYGLVSYKMNKKATSLNYVIFDLDISTKKIKS